MQPKFPARKLALKRVRPRRLGELLPMLLLALAGCVGETPAASTPPLDASEVAKILPSSVAEPHGWADAIIAALIAAKQPVEVEKVCAVVAIIQQESGFQADPPVRDLPRIVHEGLEKKLAPLGVAAKPALALLLAMRAPDSTTTFAGRIAKLRTERDLDQLFRDLDKSYEAWAPGLYLAASTLSKVLGPGKFSALNPITTAGPMQVKVNFAQDLLRSEGFTDAQVRDYLYTRAGGVRVGTARLFSYTAAYSDILFRLADYNAGVYSSRNAAFQEEIALLSGEKLALDGDLLAYDQRGEPADHDSLTLQAALRAAPAEHLWAWVIRRDFAQEKTQDFETTETWKAVREAWAAKTGKEPAYARMPSIIVTSPKLTRSLTTAWFANKAKQHYSDCRKRAGGARPLAFADSLTVTAE